MAKDCAELFSSEDLSTDERARLRELEQEVAELRMERDVLKVRREALCRIPG